MKTIILTGPLGAGKSTVAQLLAKKTKIPNVPLDRVRWYYYFKKGFSLEHELSLPNLIEKQMYWKPFEVIAVKGSLQDFPKSIIDFGAGDSYYPDEQHLSEVQAFLAPYPNIFLLLPSMDPERSLEVCNERVAARRKRPVEQYVIDSNKKFIAHKSNYVLAKHIIYTDDKPADEVADEIKTLLV